MLNKQILMATYIMTLNLKPQTHENHTDRFQTLADSHPQGMRQLPNPRPLRNHP